MVSQVLDEVSHGPNGPWLLNFGSGGVCSRMMLGCLSRVVLGMSRMTLRSIGMMGRRLMFACFVMLGCFMVVLGGYFMVVRCVLVMLCALMISHCCLSVLMGRQRDVGEASCCATWFSHLVVHGYA
jgi:hypothetical protein